MEGAAGRGRERRGGIAVKRMRGAATEPRHRREQGLRVGVARRADHGAGGPDLDDAAEIHHRDAVAEMRDHGDVV